jgi:hypothetical protein
MRDGRLQAARRDFIRCSQTECPHVLRGDCAERVQQLATSIPSVVVRVVDGEGHSISDAELHVDDALISKTLDGHAFELDPGRHVFRVEAGGHEARLVFVVIEGRKSQLVELRIGEAPAARPEKPPQPGQSQPAYAAYALGTLGIAALGSFAYFGLAGKAKERDLDECAPLCERSDYRAMKRDYIVADVSLGAGVVLLGVATYLFAIHDRKSESARVYSVTPERGGARLHYSAKF